MNSKSYKKENLAFSYMSSQALALWSKSDSQGFEGHTLFGHMLDVAAVVDVILQREPEKTLNWATQYLGIPRNSCKNWIATIAGLHDFGKSIPGFNAKWEAGCEKAKKTGLEFPKKSLEMTNHSLATDTLLESVLQDRTKASKKWIRHTVQAIAAHHGRYFSILERGSGYPKREPTEWQKVRQELMDFYWNFMAPEGTPQIDRLDMWGLNWLAGLTSAADWIASNPDWFPLGIRYDNFDEYFQDAKRLAGIGLDQAGWHSKYALLHENAETKKLLTGILEKKSIPRKLQIAGDRLLQSANGPSLMLVEAPMGEGKTELAYMAHLRLQKTNSHRGLYVASPTQATGNDLFRRTHDFLKKFANNPTDIQLVHGGASMNEQVRHLRGIANDPQEGVSVSGWFSQSKRSLLSANGVGTVDQALLGVLNVKHHFVRLWGLSNRVVVLDEVHAYDTYTSVLIETLVRCLNAMGSSVILMSATLPKAKRDGLVRAWGANPDALPETDYPRLTLIDDNGPCGESVTARPLASIAVHGLDETLETIRDQAIELIQNDGCGAVIVNTVDRAQKLFTLLQAEAADLDIELILFHARFPADERAQREKQVGGMFGHSGDNDKGWSRPERGLLVATQVAEQSLDLDFDFMISDLAPIDLLLQRAGRMHRHTRYRPDAHKEAHLWVAGLDLDHLPSFKETGWAFIYDPFVLSHTWVCLRNQSRIDLPTDIDRLVQRVYSAPELPEDIRQEVQDYIDEEAHIDHAVVEKTETQQAENVSLDFDMEPDEAYENLMFGGDDETGLGSATRLGPDSITVVPISVIDGQWTIQGQVIDPEKRVDDAMARKLYERQIRVSRQSVVVQCQQTELPQAFSEHPLLKRIYPMPMVNGYCKIGSQSIRLDDNLGLVYE